VKLVIYKHTGGEYKQTYSPYDTTVFDNHDEAIVALNEAAEANPKQKFALMNMQGGFMMDKRG